MRTLKIMIATARPTSMCASAGEDPGLRVVGHTTRGERVLPEAQNLLPDVIVMAIDLPGVNALQLADRLRREIPSVKVILLMRSVDAETTYQVTQAGVCGLLPAASSADEFRDAIKRVAAGELVYPSNAARLALDHLARVRKPPPNLYHLSARDRAVLVHIAEGKSDSEIAASLGLQRSAIEWSQKRIMSKLGIHTIAGLTQFALSSNLASLPGTPSALPAASAAKPGPRRTGAKRTRTRPIVSRSQRVEEP